MAGIDVAFIAENGGGPGARGNIVSGFRVSLATFLFLTSLTPCCADPAPVIHYAPAENLEHIDVTLIENVLTD